MTCNHRKIKKIYTHGKKSRPLLVCKECGEIVKRYEQIKSKPKKRIISK